MKISQIFANIFSVLLIISSQSHIVLSQQQPCGPPSPQCLPQRQCAFIGCCCRITYFNTTDITCCSRTNEAKFPERNPPAFNTSFSMDIENMRIENYKFQVLPSRAFDGFRIRTLRLRYNDLETIQSDSFAGLEGLRELYFYAQNVTNVGLSAFVPIQSQLTRLIVSECTPQTVDSILSLENVRLAVLSYLSLRANGLTRLDTKWFEKLTTSFTLDLSNNSVQEYPVRFFTSNVSSIYLDNNGISNLSEILVFLGGLETKLGAITVANNQIETIPAEINSFTRLYSIDLGYNKIQEITVDTFGNLNNLKNLYLASNQIKSFEVGKNQNLKTLDLSANQLVEIPLLSPTLSNVDLSSQKANLNELRNFQFEITYRYIDSIKIEHNDFTKLGTKIFCSRENTDTLGAIYSLSLDYDVALRFDTCLWRQLGVRNANRTVSSDGFRLRVINSGGRANLSEFCNCENYHYLRQFFIYLDGDCLEPLNYYQACWPNLDKSIADDGCKLKYEFQCNYVEEITTPGVATSTLTTRQSNSAISYFSPTTRQPNSAISIFSSTGRSHILLNLIFLIAFFTNILL